MNLEWIEFEGYYVLTNKGGEAPSKAWIYKKGQYEKIIEIWNETIRDWVEIARPDLSLDDLKTFAVTMYRMQVES